MQLPNTTDRRAFVTGSYAYGTPSSASDVDLVVFCSQKDLERLTEAAGVGAVDWGQAALDADYISAGGFPLRFGMLNLLVCTDEKKYEVWRRGTRELKEAAPVTRDQACLYFRRLRRKAGYRGN